jgi:hydrogenase maturation protein HypF
MTGRAFRLSVFGVVQGVGFRPAVYRLALDHGLRGWVKNAGGGVEIHIEKPALSGAEAFASDLERRLPPLARIESLTVRPAAFRGYRAFSVRKSRGGERFVFISPDIATCPACLRDIRDPGDRRYGYPFTNCTDCGPRYTIVRSLPYDRPGTTMAGFPMCPACAAEYDNPLDRRYHAQPVACPVCGPRVALRAARSGRPIPGGIEAAAKLIAAGKIVAVKGLGGFHLVCDPLNAAAVARLRRIKDRRTKPLALMARDAAEVSRWAGLSPAERRLLRSERRPIVLLGKRPGRDIPGIAPNLAEIGYMLPYTPLHHLLLESLGLVVATSSNLRDAPIMKDDGPGLARLCDAVLSHDRPIEMRADDSVVKVVDGEPVFVRRARGYVPYPQKVPPGMEARTNVLALGAELKDTVSIYKNGYVVTSQFLGDLDEYENRVYLEETVAHLSRLFDVRPGVVVSDLHPGFHSTRIARGLGLPHLQVQHHHAHVLAVMLEHGLPPDAKVLGIVWDGYGYGSDGEAWGGEFLIADYRTSERFAHFDRVRLPGGDLAAKQPWRMALSYLHRTGFRLAEALRIPTLRGIDPRAAEAVWTMIGRGTRSPLSSSCGRLFDAVSALAGTASRANEFEAEAAMRLEAAAGRIKASPYPVTVDSAGTPGLVSFDETVRAVVADVRRGTSAERIAARFHSALAEAAVRVARRAEEITGIRTVVLGGGVFLNAVLTSRLSRELARAGFRVLRPTIYSPNDESISVGQIAHALTARPEGFNRRRRR